MWLLCGFVENLCYIVNSVLLNLHLNVIAKARGRSASVHQQQLP